MSDFEAKHPRARDGKFTEKLRKEADIELSCSPDDQGRKDTELVKPDIPNDLGKAGGKVIKRMTERGQNVRFNMYGPEGWTKETGATDVLRKYLTDDQPHEDSQQFAFLDSDGAKELLEVMPSAALKNRQSNGPTLGAMLSACAANPDKVHLFGYSVDESRFDERITANSIHITIPEGEKDPKYVKDIWHKYQEKLGLDSLVSPDVAYKTENVNGYSVGWMLKWL